MKHYIILLSLVLVSAACQNSQNKGDAPEKIKKAFVKMHPEATILKWVDESPIWEAKYKEGQEKGAVSFDQEGVVTETELVIEEAQLPNLQIIQGYIRTNFPKEKAQQYEKVTRADGTVTYEIQITGKELVFDASGTFSGIEPD